VAEEQTHYDFVAVDSKDILNDRQQEWDAFTRFITISSVAIAAVLILMWLFLV
jgi:hypothetical protein